MPEDESKENKYFTQAAQAQTSSAMD